MDEALKLVENDEYQTEIVKENAEDGKVYGHKLLNHVDFTSPVSLEDAGKVKVFKVLSVAGAYWKGASSNPMLQRIYGTAFSKQKELDEELKRQQEAHERDHRVIGNNLDLFFVDQRSAQVFRIGCQTVQRFVARLNATLLTRKFHGVTNMFILQFLPMLTCTNNPGTGIIIAKTCFLNGYG